MKEHPILFSTEMVKAILDGRKIMTRRLLKQELPIGTKWHQVYDGELLYRIVDSKAVHTLCKCPYGKVGDILWVRETFLFYSDENTNDAILYKAEPHAQEFSHGLFEGKPKWKPSIFMPKEACRIWLEITNIKVERLQDISPHNACEEGVEYWNIDADAFEGGELQADFMNYTWTEKKEKDPNYEDRWFPYVRQCCRFLSNTLAIHKR
jgi:hypothetical protein